MIPHQAMGLTDDDAALLDAAIEREEIVKRYDRGNDPDAPIDEWENPSFEIYHVTDRYGFIHDSRLPSEQNQVEKLSQDKEMERETKWQKMNKDWKKYYGTEKLKNRVYKGIPDKWRLEIWRKLLRIDEIKRASPGIYKEMKEKARLTSPDIRQIDLDVNRTYRNHIMFRERYGTKQNHLFHVLAAYSMYNTEVGYCQGMSQIAALLLMYMDEEDAFWGIHRLLTDERHIMHGLFIPGFPKLLRFQDHFEHVIKRTVPKIYKFMNANMIPPSLYAIKWFMQCFLDRTPFTLTLRLYDIFMLEGERILIPMSYTIFRLHKHKLLKMSMEQFVHFLQQDLEKDFGFDDDQVIEELKVSMEKLRASRLDMPPPPKSAKEAPPKEFGTVSYLSIEQLRARRAKQLEQIQMNDEHHEAETTAEIHKTNTIANHVARITSQDSFHSDYDNVPQTQKTILVPPVDTKTENKPKSPETPAPGIASSNGTSSVVVGRPFNNQRSANGPVLTSTSAGLQTTATSNGLSREHYEGEPSKRPSSKAVILESHLPVSGTPIIARRYSNDSEEVQELQLDLSDEEPNSYFEKKLENSLEERDNSRSASRSPDRELDISNSHMFVRAAGFRGRVVSPRNLRGSVTSNTESVHSQSDHSRNSGYDGSSSASRSSPRRLTEMSPGHRNNRSPVPLHSPSSPDNRSVSSEGSITRHRVAYAQQRSMDIPIKDSPQDRIMSTSPHSPVSPDDRPAFNPGYLPDSPRRRQPIRPPSPRYQLPPPYGYNSPSAPTYQMSSRSRPVFHTYGGRSFHNNDRPSYPNASAVFPVGMNQNAPGRLAYQSTHTLPSQSASSPSTPQQAGSSKRIYIIAEPGSASRLAAGKKNYRYKVDNEDTNHNPVFL